jgi:small subunit ribosomal protein S17
VETSKEHAEAKETRNRRIYTGLVVSNKMDKTIVVNVTTRQLHTLYEKYVNRSKRVKAHDEKNDANLGDKVRVIETRPLSREKRWRLLDIVERAK